MTSMWAQLRCARPDKAFLHSNSAAMCGGPCAVCAKHVYEHGPGTYSKFCFNCYIKEVPAAEHTIRDGKAYSAPVPSGIKNSADSSEGCP